MTPSPVSHANSLKGLHARQLTCLTLTLSWMFSTLACALSSVLPLHDKREAHPLALAHLQLLRKGNVMLQARPIHLYNYITFEQTTNSGGAAFLCSLHQPCQCDIEAVAERSTCEHNSGKPSL